MLKKVYTEQKMMNKNLQRITNLILMILFTMVGKEAAARDDETGKRLCRIGVGLTAVTHALLIVSDIADLVKSQKEEVFEEDIDE